MVIDPFIEFGLFVFFNLIIIYNSVLLATHKPIREKIYKKGMCSICTDKTAELQCLGKLCGKIYCRVCYSDKKCSKCKSNKVRPRNIIENSFSKEGYFLTFFGVLLFFSVFLFDFSIFSNVKIYMILSQIVLLGVSFLALTPLSLKIYKQFTGYT